MSFLTHWNTVRTHSPAAATHPTVHIPGEPSLPPGISTELAWEVAYEHLLPDPLKSIEETPIGLLKAQDQIHHAPVKPVFPFTADKAASTSIDDAMEDMQPLTPPPSPPRLRLTSPVRGKRHFPPDTPYIQDHLHNFWTGMSS